MLIDKYYVPNDLPRPETYDLTSEVVGIGATLLTLVPTAAVLAPSPRHLEEKGVWQGTLLPDL